jgi:lysyl-tRNA synthetase class I
MSALAAFLFFQAHKDEFESNVLESVETRVLSLPYNVDARVLSAAIDNLIGELNTLQSDDEIDIQTVFYDVGKRHYGFSKEELRDWFRHLYLLLFQQEQGPRWGQYVKFTGKDFFIDNLKERMHNPFRLPT